MTVAGLARSDRERIASFVELREAMAPADLGVLVARCRADPAVLAALAVAIDDDAQLHRLLTPESRGFAMRVVQAARARRLPPLATRRPRWWAWAVAAALLLFGIGLAVVAVSGSGTGSAPWAQRVAGELRPLDLAPGMERTVATDSVWEHRDGTSLAISAGSRVGYRPDGVVLRAGRLAVVASHRPVDEPLAFHLPEGVVRIVGTRFLLQVDDQGSRVTVSEGRVRFRQHGAEVDQLLGAGEQLVAYRAPAPSVSSQVQAWTVAIAGREVTLTDPIAVSPGFQDREADIRSLAGQRGVELRANTWKVFAIPTYQVTPETIIECVYTNLDPGEIHTIGLLFPQGPKDGFNVDRGVMFRLSGRQDWGIELDQAGAVGEPRLVRIPLGQHYQGLMTTLALGCDDDDGDGSAFRLSDLRLYEP